MTPFSWTCPFCNRDTTITVSHCEVTLGNLPIESADGYHQAVGTFIVYPSPKCKKITFTVRLYATRPTIEGIAQRVKLVNEWKLIPPSRAKVHPDYIPKSQGGRNAGERMLAGNDPRFLEDQETSFA